MWTSIIWRYLSEEEGLGVHIEYEDLYDTIVWLVAIYAGGQIASRCLRMPDLVGEIVVGILLGPPLANFVPNAQAWVLLGEIGYVKIQQQLYYIVFLTDSHSHTFTILCI